MNFIHVLLDQCTDAHLAHIFAPSAESHTGLFWAVVINCRHLLTPPIIVLLQGDE